MGVLKTNCITGLPVVFSVSHDCVGGLTPFKSCFSWLIAIWPKLVDAVLPALSATLPGVEAVVALRATSAVQASTPLVASAAPMTGYRLGFAGAALIGAAGAVSALTVPRRTSGSGREARAPAPSHVETASEAR